MLRSDEDGEYQNEEAEQMNTRPREKSKAQMSDSETNKKILRIAKTTTCVNNRMPTTTLENKTTFETFNNKKLDVNRREHLKIRRCPVTWTDIK